MDSAAIRYSGGAGGPLHPLSLIEPFRCRNIIAPDARGMHVSWTSDGRSRGRRGSNPQLQPSEGDGPFFVFRRAR
jgi:hypothetical protein